MRGKRFFARISNQPPGITPADAGKTKINLGPEGTVKDHPRRCGENIMVTPRSEHEKGSPPQVRGKLAFARTQASQDGITPAGAGKTARHETCQKSEKDHPRRCGENLNLRPKSSRNVGSPPQVRGKLELDATALRALGITPAGAGKTVQSICTAFQL